MTGDCTGCNPGYELDGGKCNQCPPGTFSSGGIRCAACSIKCEVCEGTSGYCDLCTSPVFELDDGACHCPAGTFGPNCEHATTGGGSNTTVVIDFASSPLTGSDVGVLVDELCDLLNVEPGQLAVSFSVNDDGDVTSVNIGMDSALANDFVAIMSGATGYLRC